MQDPFADLSKLKKPIIIKKAANTSADLTAPAPALATAVIPVSAPSAAGVTKSPPRDPFNGAGGKPKIEDPFASLNIGKIAPKKATATAKSTIDPTPPASPVNKAPVQAVKQPFAAEKQILIIPAPAPAPTPLPEGDDLLEAFSHFRAEKSTILPIVPVRAVVAPPAAPVVADDNFILGFDSYKALSPSKDMGGDDQNNDSFFEAFDNNFNNKKEQVKQTTQTFDEFESSSPQRKNSANSASSVLIKTTPQKKGTTKKELDPFDPEYVAEDPFGAAPVVTDKEAAALEGSEEEEEEKPAKKQTAKAAAAQKAAQKEKEKSAAKAAAEQAAAKNKKKIQELRKDVKKTYNNDDDEEDEEEDDEEDDDDDEDDDDEDDDDSDDSNRKGKGKSKSAATTITTKDGDEIAMEGSVMGRLSTRTLFAQKDWQQVYWVMTDDALHVYRKRVDYKLNLSNPHNPDHWPKKKYPITQFLRPIQLKNKQYPDYGLLWNFMLEEIKDFGPSNLAKFASKDKGEVETLRKCLVYHIQEQRRRNSKTGGSKRASK